MSDITPPSPTWTAASISLVAILGGAATAALIYSIVSCLLRAHKRRRLQKEAMSKLKMRTPSSIYSSEEGSGMFLPLYSAQTNIDARNKLKKEHRRSPSSTPVSFSSERSSVPSITRPMTIGQFAATRSLNILATPPRTPPLPNFTVEVLGNYPYSPADYDQYSSPIQTPKIQSRRSSPDLPAILEADEAPPVPEIPTSVKDFEPTPAPPQLQENDSSKPPSIRRFSWEGADADRDSVYVVSPASTIKTPKTPKSPKRMQRNSSLGRLASIALSSPISPMEESEVAPWRRANEMEAGRM